MTEAERKKETVYSVTGKIIYRLSQTLGTSSTKSTLANLRNSIGRPLSTSLDIWPIMYENMPDEFLSRSGELTAEELSILTTLQLYSIHQQGKAETVNMNSEDSYMDNIGYSLSSLRVKEDSISTDRRFNALITSTSFDELTHHLRQFIKLLKVKTTTKINYPLLANDLYWFLRGYGENTRLSWARQYYGRKTKGDDND